MQTQFFLITLLFVCVVHLVASFESNVDGIYGDGEPIYSVEIDNEKMRKKFVYSYRIIYPINQHQILIIAVIHGKRLLEDLKESM